MITEDQRETVGFLQSPLAFGREAQAVERIDTHSAIVFLAGDRAYKLKRAVRYDYLDFSTLERRHAACLAEVELNRRTAPALYLGVVRVTRGADGRLALCGEGLPVEWLVEMARFDQEMLFDRLAARGALDAALMRRLAGAVVRLHRIAERRRDRGGRDGMAWVIDGNIEGFTEFGSGFLDPAAVERLTKLARAALAARADRLDARRAEGFVRWCHGDLHLRNIVNLDGEPTLFDAVEFNEQIACVDVWYDLAFLLMDLVRRGLRPLANVVFNQYLTETGDLDALPLLPLFLSCRAAVRTKTSATAAGLQREENAAAALRGAAREYLLMAIDLLEPPPPRLIAIGGLSGSGKSTLAARLAPAMGAVPGALIVRSDVIRKAMFGVPTHVALGPEGYAASATQIVYERLCEQAGLALRAGQAVIVDAVFAEPAHRSAIADVARSAGVPFAGLWLDVKPEILTRRIQHRRADDSDATLIVLRQQLGRDVGPMTWSQLEASGDEEPVARRAEHLLAGG